jgi:hypothetical protein
VSTVSGSEVVVDLEVDFHNEDETGYVWTWLSEARDPSVITPKRIVVVGDDDAIAMARVVDLVKHEKGTIVNVETLSGHRRRVLRGRRPRRCHPCLTKPRSVDR